VRLYLAGTVPNVGIRPRRTVRHQPVLRGAQNSAAGTTRPEAPPRGLGSLVGLGGSDFVSWHQQFSDPIELPGGRKLVTLRDAALYITRLPKAEQQATPWQAAAEVLMLIGEHGGDPMMAHIAMMQALQRHEPKAAPVPRRKRAKAYRIIR